MPGKEKRGDEFVGVMFAYGVESVPPSRRPRPLMTEDSMGMMRHRSYLRALTPRQRRAWWEQKKRLSLRVTIGAAWVPHQVRRSYTYALHI